ncbi:MAG: dihydrodipicolinate synthase family protein [Gemmatimonas sp.]
MLDERELTPSTPRDTSVKAKIHIPGCAQPSAQFNVRQHLACGHVIPAHPLALTPTRDMDERHQRALTRYYVDAGAGGMAVGVHTTGFPIHDAKIGLYRPVLELAADTADEWLAMSPRPFVRVAGLIGDTAQAVREAEIARTLGYHCGLLSLGAWRDADDRAILAHCRHVAESFPLFGFYLQPAVGGRRLSYGFWREFSEIANVVAIKVAPFDRYATLDVVRAVADAGRDDIALYTGNDDSILADLLTDFPVATGGRAVTRYFAGGLLGQWAVWTSRAVEWLNDIRAWRATATTSVPREWLARGTALTMANAVVFDAANGYRGCLPGILETLRRQGLVRGTWTFDTHEQLSPGQGDAIARIAGQFPKLVDDEFVAANLDRWLR